MDEKHYGYSMQAPGAADSSSSWRLPEDGWPRVDDYLDPPGITRRERIGGRRVEALPANRDHAVVHTLLDEVINISVTPGYEAASDLKTRFDEESDFASDTAILKQGKDPATGTRYLEELAFEIVDKQGPGRAIEKAKRMARRGVRRVFGIFVKKQQVAEWSQTEERWVTLHPSSVIEDERLVRPIPVKALLDPVVAEQTVAKVLVAKGNPVIEEMREQSRAEGKAEGKAGGKAEAILEVLAARGLTPSETLRRRILETTDPTLLDLWVRRAVTVATAEELLAEAQV